VTLVGAGPGDPDLLTLKALRLLQSADVILHDHLVTDAILAYAAPNATLVCVGKIGHGPSCRQSEINALMIALAHAGCCVVRLKSGDPMIFGRAGEEMAALVSAGVAIEVVPGISAAQAAAASLKVSLTHRDHAHKLQIITGHTRNGSLPEDIDWKAAADPKTTTAIYMGKRTADALVARLILHGLPPSCPAAAVFDASRPGECALLTSVEALPQLLAQHASTAPCIILIGEVLATSPYIKACEKGASNQSKRPIDCVSS
jgi:uroporphyrin-III C-methyltransferase/precorrin-2 dehydrogenase/sirohydrochlorin ferrochelatase